MNRIVFAAVCVALVLTANAPSAAQSKKKHVSKPPVKTSGAPPVKGTAQLPGDNGKLDQAYTMGVEHQLNFTLRSAEYTLGQLIIGASTYSPKKDEKLLLLKFSAQNPNKSETLFRFDSFTIIAVDSQNVNHEWVGDIVKPDENQQALNIELKPGQRVEAISGILIPANASVPKLIVQHNSGGKVLRYDMHGLIKPLPAPFADPADKSGAQARGEVPAEKNVFYSLARFDVKYVSSMLTTETLGDNAPGEGKQFLVVTLTLHNGTNSKQLYRYDSLDVRLITADGEKEDHPQNLLLKTSRNESAENELDPGDSYTCRLVLEVAKDVKPAKLVLWQVDSHGYVFDLGNTP